MRRPIRLEWRSGTLGQKLDECSACGQVGRHRIERQMRWLVIGPLGVVPLGLRHGMECTACWTWTPLPASVVRRGVRSGSLPLPGRARTAPGPAAAGEALPDPDYDAVTRSRSVDGATSYLFLWLIVVAILVGLRAQPVVPENATADVPLCLVAVGVAPGQPLPSPPFRLTHTLCVFPHNFEPLATPAAPFGPTATMPPDGDFGPGVTAACKVAFREAFGEPNASSGPALVILAPDPRSWAAGERYAWCAAVDPAHPWRDMSLPR